MMSTQELWREVERIKKDSRENEAAFKTSYNRVQELLHEIKKCL